MLVLIEMQIALALLIFRPKHPVGRGELGHDQAASAEIANEAPKHGVRDARHRSQDGRGFNRNISDHDLCRHDSNRTGEDVRAHSRRIFPVLAHFAILLPSRSNAAVAQSASHNLWTNYRETRRQNLPPRMPADGS